MPKTAAPEGRDRNPERLLQPGVVQVDRYTGTRWYLEAVHDLYVEVTALDGPAAIGLPLSPGAWCGPEFRELEPHEQARITRTVAIRPSHPSHV